jgi:ABC-type transport system involved in cytochrome bd biosynthesis fused ATPase/permease subunit
MLEWRRLGTWLRRAKPPRRDLARAIGTGVVANLAAITLLAGAVGLLVASSSQPGLRAVAGVLIVIELVAFLRSPVRFAERMASHRLGFDAVKGWRRWLTLTVGSWPFKRWSSYASGDLLDRALRDTDELQDLWLRGVIPVVTGVVGAVLSLLAILLFPGRGGWWPVALATSGVMALATGLVLSQFAPLVSIERVLRREQSERTALRVAFVSAAPEVALLGRTQFLEVALESSARRVALAERRLVLRQNVVSIVPLVATALIVAIASSLRPTSALVWFVVVVMIGLGVGEVLQIVRQALDTAVRINAASERLDDLTYQSGFGHEPWPATFPLRVENLSWRSEEAVLLRDVSLNATPGAHIAIAGISGAGKSTLLRLMARLEETSPGTISVGGVDLDHIDEASLRKHLAFVGPDSELFQGVVGDVMLQGRTTSHDVERDLASVGLHAGLKDSWSQLSRGEQQRASVVRALLSDPDILMLDEPTSGLGANETAMVLALLAQSPATVLVATHDELVMDWCDEIYQLEDNTLQRLTR